MTRAWLLPDAAATQRLGAALGGHCPWDAHAARCLFLCGELGAGKTTLAAALLEAAGVRELVRSPTYALIETYAASAGLAVHVDLYRLRDASELEQLGLRDYLQPYTLLLIEWPQRALAALPAADLTLELAPAEPGRTCRIEAGSPTGEAWMALAEQEFSPSDSI